MESVKEVKKMRELLEKYLKARGISVVEFAQEAEVSKTTIYDLLKGEKDATKIYANQAIKIAKAMNISVEELYVRKLPEPTPESKALTSDERDLLDAWRGATDAARESAMMVLRCNPAPVVKKEAAI